MNPINQLNATAALEFRQWIQAEIDSKLQQRMDPEALKVHLNELVQLEMARQNSAAQLMLQQQQLQQQSLWEDQNLAIRVSCVIMRLDA